MLKYAPDRCLGPDNGQVRAVGAIGFEVERLVDGAVVPRARVPVPHLTWRAFFTDLISHQRSDAS